MASHRQEMDRRHYVIKNGDLLPCYNETDVHRLQQVIDNLARKERAIDDEEQGEPFRRLRIMSSERPNFIQIFLGTWAGSFSYNLSNGDLIEVTVKSEIPIGNEIYFGHLYADKTHRVVQSDALCLDKRITLPVPFGILQAFAMLWEDTNNDIRFPTTQAKHLVKASSSISSNILIRLNVVSVASGTWRSIISEQKDINYDLPVNRVLFAALKEVLDRSNQAQAVFTAPSLAAMTSAFNFLLQHRVHDITTGKGPEQIEISRRQIVVDKIMNQGLRRAVNMAFLILGYRSEVNTQMFNMWYAFENFVRKATQGALQHTEAPSKRGAGVSHEPDVWLAHPKTVGDAKFAKILWRGYRRQILAYMRVYDASHGFLILPQEDDRPSFISGVYHQDNASNFHTAEFYVKLADCSTIVDFEQREEALKASFEEWRR